jgi:hypothetical protein
MVDPNYRDDRERLVTIYNDDCFYDDKLIDFPLDFFLKTREGHYIYSTDYVEMVKFINSHFAPEEITTCFRLYVDPRIEGLEFNEDVHLLDMVEWKQPLWYIGEEGLIDYGTAEDAIVDKAPCTRDFRFVVSKKGREAVESFSDSYDVFSVKYPLGRYQNKLNSIDLNL